MFSNTIGAAFAVIIALCRGFQRYAEAFEATGSIAIRVTSVADKHVQNWEFEQDQTIIENRAKVQAKLDAIKAQA